MRAGAMALRSFAVTLSILWTASSFATAPEYCVGIRGNGENVAAHWAGLGRLVEETGMPIAAAGGSSATISLFFLESVKLNPYINAISDPLQRRKTQGMLLKTMPAYVSHLLEFENVISVYEFMQALSASQSQISDGMWASLKAAQNYNQVVKGFSRFAPLVNSEMLAGLKSPSTFSFYKKQLMDAINVFGKFDAKSDANLFIRPGLVDFRYFAVWLGTIADFYAGHISADQQAAYREFLDQCSAETYQKSWADSSNSVCQSKLRSLVQNYASRDMKSFAHKRLFEQVGKGLKAFPTTAIVHGDAVIRYKKLLGEFEKGNSKEDFSQFTLNFDTELDYGFWGSSSSELHRTQQGLQSFVRAGDLKSSKFRALGSASWFEVLSTSPAEPGLANFQRIPMGVTAEQVVKELQEPAERRWKGLAYRSELSAGGWSDLHPTLVLKAAGCEQVVYLTRKNGDSVFGQQVFIRLTGLTEEIPFWTRIGEKDSTQIEGVQGNNRIGFDMKGLPGENTPWDRISNLGNRKSSFNNSIQAADIVYCTDWDSFDVFKGQNASMVEEAYRAPVFLKNSADRIFQVNPAQSTNNPRLDFPGCLQ